MAAKKEKVTAKKKIQDPCWLLTLEVQSTLYDDILFRSLYDYEEVKVVEVKWSKTDDECVFDGKVMVVVEVVVLSINEINSLMADIDEVENTIIIDLEKVPFVDAK